MYRIYGLDPDQPRDPLTAEFIFKKTPPDDIDRVQKNTQRGLKEGRPIPSEYRILRPDKTVRTVSGEGDLEFDKSGKLIRMIGTVQDITERKRAKEQIIA